MNINVVKLPLMERTFRGCSLVRSTTCLESLVRSDPKLPHFFFFVFQQSPEPRRQDTGFVFALRSWRTTVTRQASLERFKSNKNLPIHLTILFPLLARVN